MVLVPHPTLSLTECCATRRARVLEKIMNDEEPKYNDFDEDLIGTIWALSIFFGLCLIIMVVTIAWRML